MNLPDETFFNRLPLINITTRQVKVKSHRRMGLTSKKRQNSALIVKNQGLRGIVHYFMITNKSSILPVCA